MVLDHPAGGGFSGLSALNLHLLLQQRIHNAVHSWSRGSREEESDAEILAERIERGEDGRESMEGEKRK